MPDVTLLTCLMVVGCACLAGLLGYVTLTVARRAGKFVADAILAVLFFWKH